MEVIYARKVSTAPSITISSPLCSCTPPTHPSNLAHAIFLCCRWVGLFTPPRPRLILSINRTWQCPPNDGYLRHVFPLEESPRLGLGTSVTDRGGQSIPLSSFAEETSRAAPSLQQFLSCLGSKVAILMLHECLFYG